MSNEATTEQRGTSTGSATMTDVTRTGVAMSIADVARMTGYTADEVKYLVSLGAPVKSSGANDDPNTVRIDSGEFIGWLQDRARSLPVTDMFGQERRGQTVKLSQLVTMTGYAKTGIEYLLKQGAPVAREGRPGVPTKIDTAKFIGWLIDREHGSGIEDRIQRVEDFKGRKIAAQAQIEELNLFQRRGELVDITTMRRHLEPMITDTRTRLLALPTKIAPKLVGMKDPRNIRSVLETEINEALDDLSRIDPADVCAEGHVAHVGATPEADSQ